MSNKKQIKLNAQLTGGLGVDSPSWRLTGQDPASFMKLDKYLKLGPILEKGMFDAFFIADTPAIISSIANVPPYSGLDPILILTAMSQVTQHIGLVATLSTTYNEAYNVARKLRSLDLISGGRAGWNAVTTSNSHAHANFGGQKLSRPQKYDRAYEFVDAVQKLWSSWPEGALIMDKGNNQYADMNRISEINYKGKYIQTKGPILLPPSPQGQPVVFSAGGGNEGLDIALRYGNAVYANPSTLDAAVRYWAYIKQRAKEMKISTDNFTVFNGLIITLGGTEEEAISKRKTIDSLGPQRDRVLYLGQMLSLNLTILDIDSPIPENLRKVMRPSPLDPRSTVAYEFAKKGMSIREILARGPINYHPVLVGTPEQVAEQIIRWHEADVGNGFSILPDTGLETLENFSTEVVPILQKKGLVRTAYTGRTLRDNLGLRYHN